MKCKVTNCTRQAAAKGRCTTHLGLATDSGRPHGRHKRMTTETRMPRTFEFFDAPPKRINAPQTLDGELLDLAHALQDNPGKWAQVPSDLIHRKWRALSDAGKKTEVGRMARAISKGSAWRNVAGDRGHFNASRVNNTVWASWTPYDKESRA